MSTPDKNVTKTRVSAKSLEEKEREMNNDESEEMTSEDFEKLALEYGIPLSVVRGETKLSDHFSKEYINWKCNRDEETP